MTRKEAMPDYLLLFEEGEKEEQSSAVEAICRKPFLQGRRNDPFHEIAIQ